VRSGPACADSAWRQKSSNTSPGATHPRANDRLNRVRVVGYHGPHGRAGPGCR
jgi:hypothetical protein